MTSTEVAPAGRTDGAEFRAMRDKPTGLDEDQLVAALCEGWGMRVESAEYLSVGAGSYHWSVADRNGIVWFATGGGASSSRWPRSSANGG